MNYSDFPELKECPETIYRLINNYPITKITRAHKSGDFVYKIGDKYILKTSKNFERLKREKDANDFMSGKLPVSETMSYLEDEKTAYYLKTQLQGGTFLSKTYLHNPTKMADLLAEAMQMIHSLDTTGCTIKNQDSEGNCFIHGDFCLPNVLVRYNRIVGFIDTEAAGLGDPWLDYAECIWSFQYNLKTSKYTPLLLDALGITFDQEKYNKYIDW